MTFVIGTAGHIDHGKTTLLRALTGMDADRLPEERRRGMTIDIGFAHLRLPDGTELDFVDVPGHDRLIGNMLAGAGEIDGALLVVAADDGPRAQTLEHLELLDALGVRHGVVAITKCDVTDEERLVDVRAAVRRLLAPTSLAAADVIPVAASRGDGVEELREALVRMRDAALRHAATRDAAMREASGNHGLLPAGGPARLAIDRAFSVRGRGLVVTGTLRGMVTHGDTLELVPDGRSVRVREIQVHGSAVERATGGRTALLLGGVGAGEIRRGQVVASPGAVAATERLLVALRPPAAMRPSTSRPSPAPSLPGDRARLRLHLGTDAVDARLGRSGREAADLGDGRASAILRLAGRVAAVPGDRFVLRQPSPAATAAGGVVLDVDPPRGVSRRRSTPARLAALATAVATGAGWSELLELHGAIARSGGDVALAPDVMQAAEEAVDRLVRTDRLARPDMPGLALGELRAALARELRRVVALDHAAAARVAVAVADRLVDEGRLDRVGEVVRQPGRPAPGPSAAALAARDRLVALLDVPAPPSLGEAARAAGCPQDGIRALEGEGRIVRLAPDLAWSTSAWQRLAATALDRARSGPLTPAVLRDATGTSRKYVMPLIEDLDRRGLLARTPAGHVPGPRAAGLRVPGRTG